MISVLMGLFAANLSFSADQKLTSLEAQGQVYSNVTVLKITDADVFFTHARGMGNAKLKDLDPEMQKLFHYDASKASEAQRKQIEANMKYLREIALQATSPQDGVSDTVQTSVSESSAIDSNSEYSQSTLTRTGDLSPVLSIQTIAQGNVDFSGKVVVLNFFATWCGPCMMEMPDLENLLWQPLKESGLVLIAVGREHSEAEVRTFQKRSGLSFLFAADPKREIYARFATQYIPRCVLIGKDGRIKYQTIGFSNKAISTLIKLAKAELDQ